MTDCFSILDRHIESLANGRIRNLTLAEFKHEAEICCGFDFNTAKKLKSSVEKLLAGGEDPNADGSPYCGVLYASMLLQLRDDERLKDAAQMYVAQSEVLPRSG